MAEAQNFHSFATVAIVATVLQLFPEVSWTPIRFRLQYLFVTEAAYSMQNCTGSAATTDEMNANETEKSSRVQQMKMCPVDRSRSYVILHIQKAEATAAVRISGISESVRAAS